MQITLWVVLCATVGLAALVDHFRDGAAAFKLGPEEVFGPISMRLPVGWSITSEGEGVLLVQAEEGENGKARILAVLYQPVRGEMSALEFIIRSGLAPPAAARVAHPIQISGRQGVMVSLVRQVRGPDGEAIGERDLIAVAMVQTHYALILHLSSAGNSLSEDEYVVSEIAATIKLHEQEIQPQPPRNNPTIPATGRDDSTNL